MSGWQVQDVDLTGRDDVLTDLDAHGSLFLGCTISDPVAERLRAGGALVFPAVPDVPFDPWRAQLYTPAELYAGLDEGYDHTLDARVYAWSRRAATGHDLRRMLAKSLHDQSIDDALEELTHGRRLVGVMGGHALARDDAAYAGAARFAHHLADAGLTVATGGGPGAMEAANLGARLAGEDEKVLEEVLTTIAAHPGVPRGRHGLGRHRAGCGRGTRRLGPVPGHPDLALRPRAPEPVQLGGREVLPQRDPRGRPARGVAGRDRVPARCRRHGAGDLPGRVHQLLRRGGRGQDDGVRRARTTGPACCRPGR